MKIGRINIEKPLFLAPMQDVTDSSFRLVCKKLGADIFITEFVSCESLIRDIPKALTKIEFSNKERPIGIQIFGSVEESLIKSVKIIERYKPDFIDINGGCWVKNIALRGEGAGLLKDLAKFEKVVKAVVGATKLAVTVKTRLGWDTKSIVIMDVAKMVEQAGAKALTVHCRTRSQGYKGKADWSWLEKIKKVIEIPLIGNGDVLSPVDVKTLFDIGCDGVMIGRGAIHNPWIFSQAKHFLETGELLCDSTLSEKIKLCIEHLKSSVKLRGERNAILPFRKHYVGYLKGIAGVAKLRSDLMRLATQKEVVARLNRFLAENEGKF